MDLFDLDNDMPDAIALLSDDQRNLLAEYWDDSESDLANQRIILSWLRYPDAREELQ
jgi:hypothetical protein